MQPRIIRARIIRRATYRDPSGTWHRDYPAGWTGPLKRAHFEQLAAKGAAVALDDEAEA